MTWPLTIWVLAINYLIQDLNSRYQIQDLNSISQDQIVHPTHQLRDTDDTARDSRWSHIQHLDVAQGKQGIYHML